MLVYNLVTGGFKLSFNGQPVAHAQHIWNLLGMYVVGLPPPSRRLPAAPADLGGAGVFRLGHDGSRGCSSARQSVTTSVWLAPAMAMEHGVVTSAGGRLRLEKLPSCCVFWCCYGLDFL